VTSTNTDPLSQPVAAFKKLPVDEQLAALALIHTEVSGSITPATLKGLHQTCLGVRHSNRANVSARTAAGAA